MERILLENHSSVQQLNSSNIITNNILDEVIRHDVEFDELMFVSYGNGTGKVSDKMNKNLKSIQKQLINDSNLSMKFGDCSAVAGVMLTTNSI